MKSILKKISSFFYIPGKEFNIARFHYDDGRTEIEYTLKSSFFGIPICLTISEKSMKNIVDFYNNNEKAQDANIKTHYDF